MRFRHHQRPERASIRQDNDRVMDPVQAEVFRNTLPGSGSFPSGVSVGDPTEPPAQVTGVEVTAGLRTMLVKWDRLEDFQTVDGAGGYEVELDYVATFDDTPRMQRTSATMASFTDLLPNTTYFVRVRGVQGADNYGEWSDWDSTHTAQANADDIQASAITADKIAVNAVTANKLAAITMEVGKYIQSDNYDGTDVATADATQGFRIEAEGDAEFQDVRVRGDIDAATLIGRSGETNLIENGSFESPDLTTGWSTSTPGASISSVAHASTQWGTRALKVTCPAGGGDTTISHDMVSVTGGVSYRSKLNMVIAPSFVPLALEVLVALDWYDQASGYISTTTEWSGYPGNLENDFRDAITATMRAPDNAHYAVPKWTFTSTPASFSLHVDNVSLRAVNSLVGGAFTDLASVTAGDESDPMSNTALLMNDGLRFEVPDFYSSDFAGRGSVTAAVGDGGAGKRRHYIRMVPAPPTGGGETSDVYLYSGSQDGTQKATIFADTQDVILQADDLTVSATDAFLNVDRVWHHGARAWPAPRAEMVGGSKTVPSGGSGTTIDTFSSGDNGDGMCVSGWAFQAPYDGVYLFWVWASTGSNMTSSRFMVGVGTNSGSPLWIQNGGINVAGTSYISGSHPVHLNGGQWLHMAVYQDSGSNINVTARARFYLMSPV